MRLFAGLDSNLRLRVLCAAPLVALGCLPALHFAPRWLALRSFNLEMELLSVAIGGLGAVCAWRSILMARLAWWWPGCLLLGPVLYMAVMLEAHPMFDDPEPDATRVMPAVSAVLLSAAIVGIWLAWRARAVDTAA